MIATSKVTCGQRRWSDRWDVSNAQSGGCPDQSVSLDPAGGLDLSLTLSGRMWNSGQPDSMASDGVRLRAAIRLL